MLHIHEFSKSLSNKIELIKSDYKCVFLSNVYNKRKVNNLKKNIDIFIFKNPIFILFLTFASV